ncbi:MAG: hypothetical protein ACREME_00885 [Gemmatimonadales bacterium]
MTTDRIETLLDEQRRFRPPAAFQTAAHVRDQSAGARRPGRILGRLGDTTMLADPAVVAKLRDQYEAQDS